MRKHPIIGENIVMPLKTFNHLLEPVRRHHERLDGSGYPDGISGDSIPLVTRIMMVADVFDAMTSDRPYRNGLPLNVVRQELNRQVAAGKLDADVVAGFHALVDEGKLALADTIGPM